MPDQDVITSDSFQNWVQTKKVQPQDLRFLSLLTEPDQLKKFSALTYHFFDSNPSFTDGLQTIETVVDLILLKKDSEVYPFENSDPNQKHHHIQKWRQHLAQVRHPITAHNDDVRKGAIEQLKWPSGSKIKVERRGDRHGVELKVFISSATDLTKMIASLERVKDDFPV